MNALKLNELNFMKEFKKTLDVMIDENKNNIPKEYFIYSYDEAQNKKINGFRFGAIEGFYASKYAFFKECFNNLNLWDYETILEIHSSYDTSSNMKNIIECVIQEFRFNNWVWYEIDKVKEKQNYDNYDFESKCDGGKHLGVLRVEESGKIVDKYMAYTVTRAPNPANMEFEGSYKCKWINVKFDSVLAEFHHHDTVHKNVPVFVPL